MNILITGVHGFVGSNLVIALKGHHSLYGLDIVAPEKEGVVKTFAWKDIETTSFPMQQLPKFDAIIHLAGKAHDTKNQSASQVYFDINTVLLLNVGRRNGHLNTLVTHRTYILSHGSQQRRIIIVTCKILSILLKD